MTIKTIEDWINERGLEFALGLISTDLRTVADRPEMNEVERETLMIARDLIWKVWFSQSRIAEQLETSTEVEAV